MANAWDNLFPDGTTITYTDDPDYYYALLTDVYVKKIWDFFGLFMAGGLAIGFYGGYQFMQESYKTLISQV
jgi:hypothetical protein